MDASQRALHIGAWVKGNAIVSMIEGFHVESQQEDGVTTQSQGPYTPPEDGPSHLRDIHHYYFKNIYSDPV